MEPDEKVLWAIVALLTLLLCVMIGYMLHDALAGAR